MIDLRLINSEHPLKEETINLSSFKDIEMIDYALEALLKLLDSIDARELIFPVSGYRDKDFQKKIFEDSLRENGLSFTQTYVALPMHSEHQSGLAIDLSTDKDDKNIIDPEFKAEGIGKIFLDNMDNYGYILRYPKEKEAITKIKYEPWHFRYIGYPHSKLITIKRICLEEYLLYLKNYPRFKPLIFENHVIYYDEKYTPNDFEISPDNCGAYIYTKEII